MASQQLLFNAHDLRAALSGQRHRAEETIAALDAAYVSPSSEESTLDRLEGKYRVTPLRLMEDKITLEHEDAQVDVSQEPMRDIRDRSRPFFIPGKRVRYYVPYEGDKELWNCKPNTCTWNPPRGEVRDGEMVFEFTIKGASVAETKGMLETALAGARQWAGYSEADVVEYNEQLRPALREALLRRREALTQTAMDVEAVGIPVRKTPARTRSRPRAMPAGQHADRSTEEQAMEYDVALSFAGEDREYVERVAEMLQADGVTVFYDKFEAARLWGRNLADHLGEIYGKRARFVVMFASQYYATKAWPTMERQSAQARALRENEIVLLPARFDDTEIPGLPSTVGYVDLRETSQEELVALIKAKLRDVT